MNSRLRTAIGAIGLLVWILACGSLNTARAQDPNAKSYDPPLAEPAIECTGYITEQPMTPTLKVVGGEREDLKYSFWQGDLIFLSKGIEGGIKEGALYSVVRPVGEMKQPFTGKKLGYYVRELGVVRVKKVNGATSTAKIVSSCDTVWLGDFLVPYTPFKEPTPKVRSASATTDNDDAAPRGQIIMSKGYHEFLGQNDIVFLDLGTNTGIQPGDVYTIFRKVGMSEGLVQYHDDKINRSMDGGFGSKRYKGGDFSIDSTTEPIDKLMKTRPTIPTRTVGELVVLKVDGTTSVARILKSSEEVNVGDWVKPE